MMNYQGSTRQLVDNVQRVVDAYSYKLYGQQKLSPMVESVVLAAAERVFEK